MIKKQYYQIIIYGNNLFQCQNQINIIKFLNKFKKINHNIKLFMKILKFLIKKMEKVKYKINKMYYIKE